VRTFDYAKALFYGYRQEGANYTPFLAMTVDAGETTTELTLPFPASASVNQILSAAMADAMTIVFTQSGNGGNSVQRSTMRPDLPASRTLQQRTSPTASPATEHSVTSSTTGAHSGRSRESLRTAQTALARVLIVVFRMICFLPFIAVQGTGHWCQILSPIGSRLAPRELARTAGLAAAIASSSRRVDHR